MVSGPVVVSLCDRTGNMVRPWAEAGYDCVCYDMQHAIRRDRVEPVGTGRITYRWANVRSLTAGDLGAAAILFAFPPCTDLAVSGAQDFRRKGLRALIDALEVVEACRQLGENSRAPWMLENPVSRLTSCWREPDFTFNPADYAECDAEAYTKRTCLWTGGGFVMPQLAAPRAPVLGSLMHRMSGTTRGSADRRAVTPMGFARAVFDANAPWVAKAAA